MNAKRNLNTPSPAEGASPVRGFTLIELLVVIAIIVILAAMLLPALARAKAQAHSTACKNHLRQMTIALRMYVDDFRRYPYYRDREAADFGMQQWEQVLYPYYPLEWTNVSYHCPAYKGLIVLEPIGNQTHGSYGYNAIGAVRDRFDLKLGLGTRPILAAALIDSAVRVPSEMLAFGDSRLNNDPSEPWYLGGMDYLICGGPLLDGLYLASPRHGKNYNVSFCDGHVIPMKVAELCNPTNTAVLWNNDHQPHPEVWGH